MMNTGGNKKRAESKGIGLYTDEQERNTTAFDYFAEIVVGAVVASIGCLLLYYRLTVRSNEIHQHGFAEAHLWAWITSFAVVIIGAFMAHAGVIFYTRRIVQRIFRSAPRSRKRTRHVKSV